MIPSQGFSHRFALFSLCCLGLVEGLFGSTKVPAFFAKSQRATHGVFIRKYGKLVHFSVIHIYIRIQICIVYISTCTNYQLNYILTKTIYNLISPKSSKKTLRCFHLFVCHASVQVDARRFQAPHRRGPVPSDHPVRSRVVRGVIR